MDSSLLIAAGASFLAGLIGYIIARMWIKPIVGYQITKRKLDHALSQYLRQINADAGPKELITQERGEVTLRTARKHAMDLVTGYDTQIPYWYRLWLDSRKASPAEATGLLTNLSKIRDDEQVKDRIDRVRKILTL